MPSLTTGRRSWPWLLALAAVVGGAVLVVIGVRAQVSAPTPPRSIGAIDPPAPSASPASSAPSSTATGRAAPARPAPLGPSKPVTLSIPAIKLHTPVNPIGLASDGTIAVPQPGPHLNQAAWFKNSPTPGQPGPSVIEGHVDSVEGSSVFLNLGAVRPGNKIKITRADGTRVTFTVNAVRTYLKSKFPTALVYSDNNLSVPTLRLITCSNFDEATHHHIGNEVVFAQLTKVSGRPAA